MKHRPTAFDASPATELLEAASALRSSGLLSEALGMLSSPHKFDADLCAARGGIEFALGHFEDAALSYSAVVLSQPENPDAQYNLALCLQRCGRWDEAAEGFERVLRVDPDWTEALLALGACLLELNRAQDALACFDSACRRVQHGPALFGKAVALQLLGQFDEATEMYAELLSLAPNSEEVLSNCIAMNIDNHNLAGVRAHSQRLLQLSPHSEVALRGLVTAALEDGNHQAAVSYCERLLDAAPDCLEAWHNFRIAIEHFQFGSAETPFAVHSGGKI
jgi:tetratricopeptide (TPR) repeat protein